LRDGQTLAGAWWDPASTTPKPAIHWLPVTTLSRRFGRPWKTTGAAREKGTASALRGGACTEALYRGDRRALCRVRRAARSRSRIVVPGDGGRRGGGVLGPRAAPGLSGPPA